MTQPSSSEGRSSASDQAHALLINLGKGNPASPTGYDLTTYVFPDGTAVAGSSIAGLALWRWLIDRGASPSSVVFACTAAAWRDKRGAVEAEIERLHLPTDCLAATIELEVPRALDKVWDVLPPIERWLSEMGAAPGRPVRLHLDLTHAYRAIPIAHTWMALYLERRGLATPGVWAYAAFEKGDRETPVIDLSHLLELAQWAAAVARFRERLDAGELASLLKGQSRKAREVAWGHGRPAQDEVDAHGIVGKLVSAAAAAGRHFPANLPLELGLAVGQSLHGVRTEALDSATGMVFPQHKALLKDLLGTLETLAMPVARRDQPKSELLLDGAEIQRELSLAERWHAAGDVGAALRALRELLVNRVLLAWRCSPGDWLLRAWRERAQAALFAQGKGSREAPGADTPVGRLWDSTCSARNPYSHCAMEERRMDPDAQASEVGEKLSKLRELLNDPGCWDLQVPTTTRQPEVQDE